MVPYQLSTATGCMVFSVMKHLALDTGHVGTEQPPNSFALEDFCTTKMLIVAIGPRMLMDAKNIVSFVIIKYLFACVNLYLFYSALCNEDANGNVPLGKSCNRYWQCQGGYPRLQRCPAMLVFDRRSLRCVVPPTEECDIPTTQTPMEGSSGNEQQGPLVG